MNSYALACFLYSVLGFVVGFAGGALGTKWRMEAELNPHDKSKRYRLAKALSLQTAVGVVILILVAVGMTSVVQGNARTEQVVQCQTSYNQAYSEGLAERSTAAASDREAQRRFVEVSINPLATPEQKKASAQQFLADLATNDAARAENPIPIFTCPPK